jgi:hypothetical protein
MKSRRFIRLPRGQLAYVVTIMQQQACPRRISNQRFVEMLLIHINTNAPARELS